MLFSFVLIAHGSSWHLTFPRHSPFPASCCCLLPGELDDSAVEALGDPAVQQVPLKGQLALAAVGQTQLMPRGCLPLPGGSGRGGSRKPHCQESPLGDRFRETPVSFPTWVGGGDSGHSREEQSEPSIPVSWDGPPGLVEECCSLFWDSHPLSPPLPPTPTPAPFLGSDSNPSSMPRKESSRLLQAPGRGTLTAPAPQGQLLAATLPIRPSINCVHTSPVPREH